METTQPTKVLVADAGRATGINFCRSLRLADDNIETIGLEKDRFSIFNSVADRTRLMPDITKDQEGFFDFLHHVIEEEQPDLLYPAKTNEVLWEVSKRRDELNTRVFLPEHSKIELFEDKFRTAKLWEQAGIKVPKGMLIKDEDDLRHAFKTIGQELWLRKLVGSGGAGSIAVKDFDLARAWIDRFNGWGNFMAAEVLTKPPEMATWAALWKEGELIVSQIRKRLFWEFAYLSPSGVTGVSGAQSTVKDPLIDEISMAAIQAIDDKPEGIISLDYTYDQEGYPNPTEVQASRFYTSMYFLARAGLNLPHIFLKLALGREIPEFKDKFSPLPEGAVWIKYIEREPVLTTMEEIQANVDNLNALQEQIRCVKA